MATIIINEEYETHIQALAAEHGHTLTFERHPSMQNMRLGICHPDGCRAQFRYTPGENRHYLSILDLCCRHPKQ